MLHIVDPWAPLLSLILSRQHSLGEILMLACMRQCVFITHAVDIQINFEGFARARSCPYRRIFGPVGFRDILVLAVHFGVLHVSRSLEATDTDSGYVLRVY